MKKFKFSKNKISLNISQKLKSSNFLGNLFFSIAIANNINSGFGFDRTSVIHFRNPTDFDQKYIPKIIEYHRIHFTL